MSTVITVRKFVVERNTDLTTTLANLEKERTHMIYYYQTFSIQITFPSFNSILASFGTNRSTGINNNLNVAQSS